MRKLAAIICALVACVCLGILAACGDVAVESVTLDKTAITLTVGDEETLTATVTPDNATDKTVFWSSSDTSVATVNGGKVTAQAEGTATITAKAGEKSATCTVTVNKAETETVAVESVTLDKTAITLTAGDEETLTATVTPDNATDKTVVWSSSDTSVATVNGGKVTAQAEGTATITAKAGEKSATCTVTVNKAEAETVAVESVTLDKTAITLTVGDEETLTATVTPDNATDKTVVWSSSDTSVATVNGGKVTAVAEGTATITAKAGEKSATCTVTVNKANVKLTETEWEEYWTALGTAESYTVNMNVEMMGTQSVQVIGYDEVNSAYYYNFGGDITYQTYDARRLACTSYSVSADSNEWTFDVTQFESLDEMNEYFAESNALVAMCETIKGAYASFDYDAGSDTYSGEVTEDGITMNMELTFADGEIESINLTGTVAGNAMNASYEISAVGETVVSVPQEALDALDGLDTVSGKVFDCTEVVEYYIYNADENYSTMDAVLADIGMTEQDLEEFIKGIKLEFRDGVAYFYYPDEYPKYPQAISEYTQLGENVILYASTDSGLGNSFGMQMSDVTVSGNTVCCILLIGGNSFTANGTTTILYELRAKLTFVYTEVAA